MDKLFQLKENRTDVRTEVIAGITTFLAMAYIVVVNPAILVDAGMPFPGVLFATVLVCAFSSMAMGLHANLPYGVAPGMGINAFFTYGLVVGMEIPWQTALGAVFISGIIFMLLSITGIRTEIVRAIPHSLRRGLAAGIGVFLSFIGFKSVNFIVSNPATIVGAGQMTVVILLFLVGLILTATLTIRKVRGAFTIGILIVSLLALALSLAGVAAGWLDAPLLTVPDAVFAMPDLAVFFKLDIMGALKLGMVLPIFALFFVDMFDSIGTFVGVAEVAGLVDEEGEPVRIGEALLMDGFSTTISGLFGSSSGTVYVESAAGIREGGRTGLTAVVTGLLFLPFMFLSPLLSFVPAVATAPVLVLVGIYMTEPLMDINWRDFEEAIPAFMSFVLIPLTFSITEGVVWGFLTYTLIKICLGKARDVHWMVYITDLFAILSLLSPR